MSAFSAVSGGSILLIQGILMLKQFRNGKSSGKSFKTGPQEPQNKLF